MATLPVTDRARLTSLVSTLGFTNRVTSSSKNEKGYEFVKLPATQADIIKLMTELFHLQYVERLKAAKSTTSTSRVFEKASTGKTKNFFLLSYDKKSIIISAYTA